jgi:hypothetical protein
MLMLMIFNLMMINLDTYTNIYINCFMDLLKGKNEFQFGTEGVSFKCTRPYFFCNILM